jgi:intracellular septation protein
MSADGRPTPHPGVKLALELGPLILFFVVFSKWGIFAATGVFMVTSVVSLAYFWVTQRRLPTMPLVTAVLVLVLGGLTLYLQDETFIKLKLTVINGLFGTTLLVGLLLRRTMLKHLLGEALQLADRGWKVMTYLWIVYFYSLAALNEVVWRNTTTETWVKFKIIAIPVLTLVFFLALTPVISRHGVPETDEA